MQKLTVEHYHEQQADCDNLCVITEDMVTDNPNLMRCVTCPFCKETVNAILTDRTISCPACDITVDR